MRTQGPLGCSWASSATYCTTPSLIYEDILGGTSTVYIVRSNLSLRSRGRVLVENALLSPCHGKTSPPRRDLCYYVLWGDVRRAWDWLAGLLIINVTKLKARRSDEIHQKCSII